MASDWLIGSYPDFPAQSIAVEDELAASEAQSVATGDYYLIHPTASLSLADQLKAAVNAHSNISDCDTEIMESGKIRIWRTGASNFAITWTNTTVRDVLGFTGNLTGASSYVASKSAYWWSANRKASPTMSPLGIAGKIVSDAVVGSAGDATTRVAENNTYRINNYFWRYVPVARIWTSSEAGGEWYAFHDAVIRKGRQFYLWPDVDEDSTDDATSVTLANGLGPYKAAKINWDYSREIVNVDRLARIDLPVIQVTEFS